MGLRLGQLEFLTLVRLRTGPTDLLSKPIADIAKNSDGQPICLFGHVLISTIRYPIDLHHSINKKTMELTDPYRVLQDVGNQVEHASTGDAGVAMRIVPILSLTRRPTRASARRSRPRTKRRAAASLARYTL